MIARGILDSITKIDEELHGKRTMKVNKMLAIQIAKKRLFVNSFPVHSLAVFQYFKVYIEN